jgi:hypothetical protein
MMLDVVFAAAMALSPYHPLPGGPAAAAPTPCAKESRVTATDAAANGDANTGVANLPFAMGKRFATLDAYLAHLERYAGPIDLPWWREVRPGIYEHVMTATNAQPETATRAELMKRFGFSD